MNNNHADKEPVIVPEGAVWFNPDTNEYFVMTNSQWIKSEDEIHAKD